MRIGRGNGNRPKWTDRGQVLRLPNGDRIEVWERLGIGWFWHVRAANGRIITSGGEWFTRKSSARRAAVRAILR